MVFREYSTDEIVVHWDSSRCIHTAMCLQALPQVFDVGRSPWIDLAQADPERVADAVRRCPTGALQFELRGDAEVGDTPTSVMPVLGGPLVLRGKMTFRGPGGERMSETRVALCRCGASANKPFCDNSHVRIGFEGLRLKDAPDREAAESPADIAERQADTGREVR